MDGGIVELKRPHAACLPYTGHSEYKYMVERMPLVRLIGPRVKPAADETEKQDFSDVFVEEPQPKPPMDVQLKKAWDYLHGK